MSTTSSTTSSASKRKCEDEQEGQQALQQGQEDEQWPGGREKRRKVEFGDVTIYNFKRRQGFICVPSQVRLCTFYILMFCVSDLSSEVRGVGYTALGLV